MIPQWIIEKKRDGRALTDEEIREFIAKYTDGTIPDYQMAALAMAIYFQGMTPSETTVLTDAMMTSGEMVDTTVLSRPTADKHSTGGIGDKVSLILAPLVACCGVAVPMLSGRGLGITGGTLDKLEAIPGYRTDLNTDEFLHILQTIGCSITGQTARIAPADKKLYALRDVTATVPSIPLIAASIMSKKLAEGAANLVLDIKCGSGAFMKTHADAKRLGETMVAIGTRMGRGMQAMITDMNQPLGRTAGNGLEVIETIEALQGGGPDDLRDVTLALSEAMLLLTGVENDSEQARTSLLRQLDAGHAFEMFGKMVAMHGGDRRVLDTPRKLADARITKAVEASSDGMIQKMDADTLGRVCLLLGAGRSAVNDAIDPHVGISALLKVGDPVSKGQPVMLLHANRSDRLEDALRLAPQAVVISDQQVPQTPLIMETIR